MLPKSITQNPAPVFNIFPQFSPRKISSKEAWRNLTYQQYTELKTEFTKNGLLAEAHQNKAIHINLTALEIAYDAFVTLSPAMNKVKHRAGILTIRNEPVLITGESGTGKELIANILHGNREGKLVGVNITSVVDTLFESELFGHKKGSFTGAVNDRQGKIAAAADGTLFLDEIGEMPLSLQAKILRVLQSGVYQPVGSDEDVPVRCRFVFATHCDLEKMVEQGKFRLDLFFRLNVARLHLSPLRERREDIPKLARVYGVPEGELGRFIEMIKEHPLRGNCRELQGLIFKFVLFGETE